MMSLGAITKQLAQEALGSQVKDVMDSLRPGDSAAAPDSDNLSAAVMAQVQAMQAALKEDQELLLQCMVGPVTLRVLELFAPSPRLLVLSGLDADRATARIISPVESVQLVCKPVAVKPEAKPARVRLVTPRPK